MPFAGLRLIVPAAIITGIAILLACFIGRATSFYRDQIDKEVAEKRYHSIDGLRGFLALAVMLHHAVITHGLYETGRWQLPPSHLAISLGRGGVAFFFMITAFLFWTRVLQDPSRFNVHAFYWGRIRRVMPMYLTSASALVVAALCFTHFEIKVPLIELGREIASWLTFPTLLGQNINGYAGTRFINTVYWSLAYEWAFYIALPLLLLFTRGTAQIALTIVSGLLIFLLSDYQVEYFFITGMAVAALSLRFRHVGHFVNSKTASLVTLAMLCLAVRFDWLLYNWLGALMLLIPFFCIANGNTLFGVLTARSARLLGMISYSVYLTHNFVLYICFLLINHVHGVISIGQIPFWTATAFCAVVTIAFSALTYRFIEYPALHVKMPGFLNPGIAGNRAGETDDVPFGTGASKP